MKKWAAVIFLIALTAAACDDEKSGSKDSPVDGGEKKSGAITGEWYSTLSDAVFFDTENEMFYYGYDSDSSGTVDWETETQTSGSIADHSDYDDEEGYLVIKVETDTYATYGTGTYTVVRWNNCDGSSLDEASAAKYTADNLPDGPQSYESADDALENLTEENGYFSYYGSYSKK